MLTPCRFKVASSHRVWVPSSDPGRSFRDGLLSPRSTQHVVAQNRKMYRASSCSVRFITRTQSHDRGPTRVYTLLHIAASIAGGGLMPKDPQRVKRRTNRVSTRSRHRSQQEVWGEIVSSRLLGYVQVHDGICCLLFLRTHLQSLPILCCRVGGSALGWSKNVVARAQNHDCRVSRIRSAKSSIGLVMWSRLNHVLLCCKYDNFIS